MISKRFFSALLTCTLLLVPMTSYALAADAITDRNDTRISAMLNAIDQQNFENASIGAEQAKKYVSHFLFDSGFAAIGGGKFEYPNSGSYVTYVTDGTYTQNISLSKGCMAHSLYMSKVFYGTEANNQMLTFKSGQKEECPMAYDDRPPQPPLDHHLTLLNREELTVSGVEDVESFDETSILLSTAAGTLSVRGIGLHIEKLSLDGGDLMVNGVIDALTYVSARREQGGFFARLFG